MHTFGFVLLVLFLIGTGPAGAGEHFYKEKTVRIIVPFSPGSSSDTYSRLIGRYISHYIPGTPRVIVQNLLGGRGILATNYLYNKARRDGTVIGQINWDMWYRQVVGQKEVRFDLNKLNAIGATDIENYILYSRKDRFKALGYIKRSRKRARVGVTRPLVPGHVMGKIFEMLKDEELFEYVFDYSSTQHVSLAFRYGEVDVSGNSYSSFMNQLGDMWEAKDIIILAQTGTVDGNKSPEFSDAPLFAEMAKTPGHKRLVRATFLLSRHGHPYAMSPGVPADRIAIMRRAFDRTMKDTRFLRATKNANLSIFPASGSELQKLWTDFLAVSSEDIAIIKHIITGKKPKPTNPVPRTTPVGPDTPTNITPAVFPRTSDPPIPSPMDPLDPIKQAAPPGRATAAGSRVVVSAPTIGADRTEQTPPPEVTLDYESTEHQDFIKKCESPAASFANFRTTHKTPIAKLRGKLAEHFLSLVDQYDTHCLRPLGHLNDILSVSERAAIQRRVGVLMYRGKPRCNAVRISDRTVLTAYHCLFNPVQKATKTVWKLLDHRQMTFAAYHLTSREVPVSAVHPNHFYSSSSPRVFRESKDEHDFVKLSLDASPDDTSFSPLQIRKPMIYDRLTLLAYHKTLESAHDLRERLRRKTTTGDWRRHFRVDTSATCRAHVIVKGCVAHACQTELGSSGAPLLRIADDGDLELVAIHVRGTSVEETGSCKHDHSRHFPNLGVYPDGIVGNSSDGRQMAREHAEEGR